MKIIHQIFISENNVSPSSTIANRISAVKQLYGKDYRHYLYTNEECREEVKKLSPSICKFYDKLLPYAFKADLARYVMLYLHGGYYYDVSVVPEYRFESLNDSLLYEGIPSKLESNFLPLIENNFMFFRYPEHPFLFKAIEKTLSNIHCKKYGRHPLDITGPIMLGDLDSSSVTLGKVIRQSDKQKASFINDRIHYFHKPKEHQARLDSLGCKGTNNYEEMWFKGQVFS